MYTDPEQWFRDFADKVFLLELDTRARDQLIRNARKATDTPRPDVPDYGLMERICFKRGNSFLSFEEWIQNPRALHQLLSTRSIGRKTHRLILAAIHKYLSSHDEEWTGG